MISQPLTKNDKNNLLSEIVQIILSFVFVGIIVLLFLITGMMILSNSENEFVVSNLVILRIFIIGLILTVFIFFVSLKILQPLKDFLAGKKLVKLGVITNKTTNTNYGYHQNIGADMVSKPKLVEYFIHIDNIPYFVEQDTYHSLNNGDSVLVSFTYFRRKLIEIKKENSK